MRLRLILCAISISSLVAFAACGDGDTLTAPPSDRTTLNDGENSGSGGTSDPPDKTDASYDASATDAAHIDAAHIDAATDSAPPADASGDVVADVVGDAPPEAGGDAADAAGE